MAMIRVSDGCWQWLKRIAGIESGTCPRCPTCGSIMLWHSLTIDGELAESLHELSMVSAHRRAAMLLVCMGENNCPNGWDATQDRMKWN